MTISPAIRCIGISKRYRIGQVEQYHTLRDAIARTFSLSSRRSAARLQGTTGLIWALSEVTFSVEPGEVLAVIGRNGSGKSTLLRILARITRPTSGRAEIVGRAASLLEIGTGFHLELTGRENVYLNGAILGLRKREIAARFDEIVAFAELEPFLETPVKHYSTGMYMRLAFSIAAHLQAEVLLIDEVLAVGDETFQKKCLAKMSELARSGCTALFVSHNLDAVRALCARALWLDAGRLVMDGETSAVTDEYLRFADSSSADAIRA